VRLTQTMFVGEAGVLLFLLQSVPAKKRKLVVVGDGCDSFRYENSAPEKSVAHGIAMILAAARDTCTWLLYNRPPFWRQTPVLVRAWVSGFASDGQL